MRPDDAIPDAPVYTATMAEMENLEELLANANELAMRYGAVRIDPPADWQQPPLRMNPKSRFFVRMQTLPAAPFVHPDLVKQANATRHHPRKRTRRKHARSDQDSDEPEVIPKDAKTSTRDRAARAASRSQRNLHHQAPSDPSTAVDRIANPDCLAERAPNHAPRMPPNPSCTPATSAPASMNLGGVKPNFKEEEWQSVPRAMGRSSATLSLPPAPSSQIQPNSASPGQPIAVREAELRLVEAFTGFAKAGPVANATPIPPCPFSQQTAQEHMAKRTAEDQTPFTGINASSLPQFPSVAGGRVFQPNRAKTNGGPGTQFEQRIMPGPEVLPNHRDFRPDRGVFQLREERNMQVNCVQRTEPCVHPPGHCGYVEGNMCTAVRTSTAMPQGNTAVLRTTNSNANGRASHMNPQIFQVIATSSLPFHSPQPSSFPMTATGLNPNDRATVRAAVPHTFKPAQHPFEEGRAEKTLPDFRRPVPFTVGQARAAVPHQFGPFRSIADNQTEKRPHEWRRPSFAGPQAPTTSSGHRIAMARPMLRSAPLSGDGTQPYAARVEKSMYRPTMPSGRNPARSENEHLLQRPRMIEPRPSPHQPSFESFSRILNFSTVANRSSLVKTDHEVMPHSDAGLVQSPYRQPPNTDIVGGYKPAGEVSKIEQFSHGPPQHHEIQKSTLEQKSSTEASGEGNQFFTPGVSVKKITEEPLRSVCESRDRSASFPPLGFESHPDRPKQNFPTALAVTPCENVNKAKDIPPLGGSSSLSDGQVRKHPTSNPPYKTAFGFAEKPKISPTESTENSGLQKTGAVPTLCESADLSSVRRDAIQAGREILEEILAVAMSGASELTVTKVPPEEGVRSEVPTHDKMKLPENKNAPFDHENCRPRRDDVMQIDTFANGTVHNSLQPAKVVQTTRTPGTDQRLSAIHDTHPGRESGGVPSKVIVAACHPVQDVLQNQQLSCDAPMIDTMPDRLSKIRQNENISLARRLILSSSLQQQQASSPPQLKQSAAKTEEVLVTEGRRVPPRECVKTEEVVLVTEKGTAPPREGKTERNLNPVPITKAGAPKTSSVAESHAQSSCAQPRAKRISKRKMENRLPHFDQDDAGRLTKAIVFPDSGTPVSLAAYKKKAQEHHEVTKIAINHAKEAGPDTFKAENLVSTTDMRDVDTLEAEFWKAMTNGIGGKAITVAYGVDVEAEGAFDSLEMSYVEWHGTNASEGKPRKRKRGRSYKQRAPHTVRRPRSSEHFQQRSTDEPVGPCADYRYDDADEEMEYDDDSTLGTLARKRMIHGGNEKLSPPESRHQRTTSVGPRNHVGTLNRDGLLRHLPRMPGINHSMFYVGQLFTRFCWHTEDAFLNSVSYLHPGSAEKIWYAVPPEYAPAFETYAASNVFSPEILENESTGQILLMNKTTMFDPRRVRRKGVLVYRVVHKPGSFVLTAARAYHAGFNCGFNIAEAVNFASPTWFSVGRQASLFARQTLKPLCVPWEYLLFHEAKSMRDMVHGAIERATSRERLNSNARVVAKELKAIIMDGEMKIRQYAEARNCRISMLHQIDGLAKNNQVGPEFGNGAGMVCSLCAHTCHFYAEMCASCDDSFEARCVDHFGEGHQLCLKKTHKSVIVRRHDPVLLLDILGCLEEMAGITVDATEQSRRYLGYLRTWQTPLKSSGLRLRLDLKAAASRLPPKVSREKGNREKAVRDKAIRGKRRRVRKPSGTLAHEEVKRKHGMFPQAEGLRDVRVTSSTGIQFEKRSEGEYKVDDVVQLTSKIPLLQ